MSGPDPTNNTPVGIGANRFSLDSGTLARAKMATPGPILRLPTDPWPDIDLREAGWGIKGALLLAHVASQATAAATTSPKKAKTIPWIDAVRKRKSLMVYVEGSITKGIWTSVLTDAISEFNRLSKKHNFGVRFKTTNTPPKGQGGADVSVAAADGRISCSHAGHKVSDTFDGKKLHGSTLLFQVGGKLEKAFMFLPSDPKLRTPQNTYNPVGKDVMKVIAVHELMHACGLTNGAHSKDDVFHGTPQVDDTGQGNKVRVVVKGKYVHMPPIVVSATTADVIRKLWK